MVAFAGSVADSLHVVVAHDGNLRTTYAFLADISVRAGDRVARGQVVGAAGSSGPEHEAGGLHFGVRLGDRYLDPQRLFGVCDLTQLVRLIPADEVPAEPWDAQRVVSGSLTSGGSGVAAVAGDLAGALGDAAGAAVDAGRSGWDAMGGAVGATADGARTLAGARRPSARGAGGGCGCGVRAFPGRDPRVGGDRRRRRRRRLVASPPGVLRRQRSRRRRRRIRPPPHGRRRHRHRGRAG